VALCANAADVLPALVARNVVPDLLTGSNLGARPAERLRAERMTLADADALRRGDPEEYVQRSVAAMAVHVRAMLDLKARGAVDVRLRATTSARRP